MASWNVIMSMHSWQRHPSQRDRGQAVRRPYRFLTRSYKAFSPATNCASRLALTSFSDSHFHEQQHCGHVVQRVKLYTWLVSTYHTSSIQHNEMWSRMSQHETHVLWHYGLPISCWLAVTRCRS